MDNFFLHLPPKKQQPSILPTNKLLLLGSCFVENIGKKLKYYKFQTEINPFGIIFHPKAIEILIKRIAEKRKYTETDIFFHNEQWHCFEVHSKLSCSNKTIFLKHLNSLLKQTFLFIQNASHIILTFGTAWGYSNNSKIVSNCHKLPQKKFNKLLSSPSAITKSINGIYDTILTLNSNITIISTVSPIRHLKDGIIENNISKAHLLSGLHSAISDKAYCHYYPAYELIMDCLREYRFYKSDLIHPNQVAIDFIWNHFKETWINNFESKLLIKEVTEIQQGLAHKAFNPKSEAHQRFLTTLYAKKEVLLKKYPDIVF